MPCDPRDSHTRVHGISNRCKVTSPAESRVTGRHLFHSIDSVHSIHSIRIRSGLTRYLKTTLKHSLYSHLRHMLALAPPRSVSATQQPCTTRPRARPSIHSDHRRRSTTMPPQRVHSRRLAYCRLAYCRNAWHEFVDPAAVQGAPALISGRGIASKNYKYETMRRCNRARRRPLRTGICAFPTANSVPRGARLGEILEWVPSP